MRCYLIPLLAVLLGCETPTAITQSTPIAAAKATTLQDAFRDAAPIRAGTTPRINVLPGRVPLVNLGGTDLLVVPAIVDASKSHTIIVRSYVTRATDGSHVLFYPVVSVIDDSFRVYQTLKPRYEFAFEGNRLLNEFTVPAGVERLLVHTDQEYFRGPFVGATSTERGPSGGAYGVAGALGGVVGALVLHATTTGKPQEFRLGEHGVIDIEAR